MKPTTATAFLIVLGAAPCALADDPAVAVVITSVGPKEMRVRAAGFTNGFVFPCSSSLNTQLFEGPVEPGQQVPLRTADGCVCIEHTYDDFPESNWSVGQVACSRRFLCVGGRGARRCWPNPDPAIRVTLSSAVPPRHE